MVPVRRRSIRVRLFYVVAIFGVALSLVFMGIATINELVSTTANVRQTLVLASNRTHTKVEDYFATNRDVLEFLSTIPGFHTFRLTADTRKSLVAALHNAQESFGLKLCYFGRE